MGRTKRTDVDPAFTSAQSAKARLMEIHNIATIEFALRAMSIGKRAGEAAERMADFVAALRGLRATLDLVRRTFPGCLPEYSFEPERDFLRRQVPDEWAEELFPGKLGRSQPGSWFLYAILHVVHYVAQIEPKVDRTSVIAEVLKAAFECKHGRLGSRNELHSWKRVSFGLLAVAAGISDPPKRLHEEHALVDLWGKKMVATWLDNDRMMKHLGIVLPAANPKARTRAKRTPRRSNRAP